jgi:CelD/BcsL family acetyltransferase involved in cellulose biosynthesis
LLNVSVHRRLDEIAPAWRDLERANAAFSVFKAFDFADLWLAHFARGRDLRAIVVRSDDRPVLVLPLCESEARGRHFEIVGLGLADEATIPRATEGPAVARAALSALDALPPGWNRVHLGQVAEPLAAVVAREARALGFPTLLALDAVSPYLPLEGGWDGVTARLSANFRKELRNKRSRLEKRGGLVLRRESPVADFDGRFAELLAVERASGKAARGMDLLGRPRDGEFVRELFRRMNDAGFLSVATVAVNGAVVAYQVGFLKDGRYLAYNTSFDAAYVRESPGVVLEAELIRGLAESGAAEYDFSRGKDFSKDRWRPLERRHLKVLIFERAPGARLRYAARSLLGKAKDALRRPKV